MYQPAPPPRDIKDVIRAAWVEFVNIAKAINQPEVEYIQYKVLNAAPDKPRIGCMYLADGSNWDPLSVGGSDPYFVWYTGSAYRGLHETGNGTNLS